MGETRAGEATLVDHRVHVREPVLRRRREAPAPGFRDEVELGVLERGECADVARRMDDYLLALDGGVEVRHDAYRPGPALGQHERLRWRPILAARAKRAACELV